MRRWAGSIFKSQEPQPLKNKSFHAVLQKCLTAFFSDVILPCVVDTDRIDKIEEISLLLDFYGGLISDKQREYLRLYHEENCSLSEIGEMLGVSRQGVYDGVRKAQNALRSYEKELGLIASYKKQGEELARALVIIDGLEGSSEDPSFTEKLSELRSIIRRLDQ